MCSTVLSLLNKEANMPHVHNIYNGVEAAFLSQFLAYLCFRDIELKYCIFGSPVVRV